MFKILFQVFSLLVCSVVVAIHFKLMENVVYINIYWAVNITSIQKLCRPKVKVFSYVYILITILNTHKKPSFSAFTRFWQTPCPRQTHTTHRAKLEYTQHIMAVKSASLTLIYNWRYVPMFYVSCTVQGWGAEITKALYVFKIMKKAFRIIIYLYEKNQLYRPRGENLIFGHFHT